MADMSHKYRRFVLAVAVLFGDLIVSPPSDAQQLKKINVVYTIVSGDSTALWVAQEK